MIRFSSPSWLSLFSLEARGDEDLPDGVHLRILSQPLLGLPIAPWTVWQVPVHATSIETPRRPTRRVTIPVEPDPSESDTWRYVAVEAVPRPDADRMSISLIDPDSSKVISRRSEPPYILGGPIVRRVRLDGDSTGARLILYAIHQKSLFELERGAGPMALMPLPIEDDCEWHFGGVSPKQGMERVARGAPKRFTPLDRPDGQFEGLVPDDEVARVSANGDEVNAALEQVVRAPERMPWEETLAVDQPGIGGEAPRRAGIPQLDSVLMAACDPGFARYLGFADNFGDKINQDIAEPLVGVVVAGLFAVDPKRVLSEWIFGSIKIVVRLQDRLPDLTFEEEEMIQRVIKVTGAENVAEKLRNKGLTLRCFTAPGAAVPPADPPAPNVSLSDPHWIAAQSGVSVSFRQGFGLAIPPFAPLLAMARDEDGKFRPRTRPVSTESGERQLPLLIGRADDGSGIASDAPVPAGPPTTYRFHVGDIFGRFGPPSDIDVPEPARPAPPAPAPRVFPLRVALDDQAPGALSSGTLDVRVPVPDDGAIGIGGRPIATLTLGFAGEARTLPATSGDMIIESFDLPPLGPQQSGAWDLTATFFDDQGRASPEARQAVPITDGRRPRAIPAGPGIIWTSRPGPSPDVELRLSWPGAAGQAYRAWIVDQRGLDLGGDRPRAAIALDGYTRQQGGAFAGFAPRFRQLTEAPIPVGGDGRARLDTTLPRTLQTVSFIRIVPVTDGHVEADFDACGLVPVAVPSDLRPPTPRLSVRTDENGAVEVTIEAVGLDLGALAATEPGLFAAPPTSARPPEFRLRRASGAVKDPLYARILGRISPLMLERDGGAPRFVARVGDTSALLPFVRYTWWAEVRLPPERRLPADAVMLPPPGAITAENVAQSVDASRPFSLISAPATLVVAPTTRPTAIAATALNATVVAVGGGKRVDLSIFDAPVAHAQAVGLYRLRIWIQWATEPPSLDAEVPITTTAFTWSGPVRPIAAAEPLTVFVTIVDPLGRESIPTSRASP